MIFCVVWSVGASTDYEGRVKFNEKLRMMLAKKGYVLQSKSYYDYYFNEKSQLFDEWTVLFKDFEVKPQLQYHEIIVPTADSYRSTYLTKMLLEHDYHVMLPGPTGTGKSINAYNLISSGMG